MKSYTLNRSVPVYASADVVVIGGGPAGTAAAIAASRCGKKVILAERSGQLGGMGTLGNVSVFMGVGNITGIYKEIVSEFIPETLTGCDPHAYGPQFNPFLLRHYLNRKLEQEKVDVLFHTYFTAAVKKATE